MPSHSHDIYANSYAGNLKIVMQNDNSPDGPNSYGVQDSLHDNNRTAWALYAAAAGGSGAHNNVEPYIVTYIYKRVK